MVSTSLKRISPQSAASGFFLLFLAVSAAFALFYQFLLISYPHQLDYGEGPLVNHAIRLAGGEMIYQPDLDTPPYTVTNYPPLYILIIAAGRLLFPSAPPFLFGRLISFISTWAAAMAIGAIIHKDTNQWKASLAGALIFGCIPFVFYWSALLRIDMLALALSLWGLYLVVSKPDSVTHLIFAAILLLAAIYTRQSYGLAAPLAAFVHLLTKDWRKAFFFAFGLGSAGLLIFLIANLVSDGGFYLHIIIANQNQFSLERGVELVKYFAQKGMLPLLATIPMLVMQKANHNLRPLLITYLLGSLASALTAGKIGSSYNYLMEISAATALGFGLFFNFLSKIQFKSKWFLAVYPIMIVLALISMTNTQATMLKNFLASREIGLKNEAESIRLAQDAGGIVLADRNNNPILAIGQPIYFQFFERVQMANDGNWQIQPFVAEIKDKKFSLIILTKDIFTKERWTPEMFDALNLSYTLQHVVGKSEFYYPKPGD